MSNLIQIIRELLARFLGTVKDSLKYPFYFVELNEDGKTSVNGRAVMQLYGMRTSLTAIYSNPKKPHDKIQATVLRHGQGKTRAARIATSIPEAMRPNTFVCETNSYKVKRVPHTPTPPALAEGAKQQ